jgi:hypothetical protein
MNPFRPAKPLSAKALFLQVTLEHCLEASAKVGDTITSNNPLTQGFYFCAGAGKGIQTFSPFGLVDISVRIESRLYEKRD